MRLSLRLRPTRTKARSRTLTSTLTSTHYSQAGWESSGWINTCDPRGWTQWYFRFYSGRRLAGCAEPQILTLTLALALALTLSLP